MEKIAQAFELDGNKFIVPGLIWDKGSEPVDLGLDLTVFLSFVLELKPIAEPVILDPDNFLHLTMALTSPLLPGGQILVAVYEGPFLDEVVARPDASSSADVPPSA